jgi:pyruvate kinase
MVERLDSKDFLLIAAAVLIQRQTGGNLSEILDNISDTISRAIQDICQCMPIHKVIPLTRSGYTARMIARFKIAQPIIAVTPEIKVKKQLELIFGVYPVLINYREEKDRLLTVANQLHKMHLVDDEETILFTEAVRTVMEHASNSIEIHKIKELREFASAPVLTNFGEKGL